MKLKKVLSLVTAAAILFMLLPANIAFADSALGNFTGTQNNSGNWWLNQNLVVSTTAELTGSATYRRGIQLDYNTGQVDNQDGSLFVIQNGGTLTISGSTTINGNYASADSPMFVVENGGKLILKDDATLDYGRITRGNWVGGGAVYVKSGGVFEMTGGTINNSFAVKGGGVCLEDGATMTMTGGSITGCTATDSGGGIYASSGSTLQMQDVTVSGCSGNGVMTGGTFTMSGTSEIKNNSTSYFGGGLCVFGGTADISEGTKITDNSCSIGGGIAITSGTVTIDGLTLSSNTSNTSIGTGGGIFMSRNDVSLTVKNSIISSNVSMGDGGGVYIGTGGGSAVFENCEISNNEAAANGGGIYMSNGTYVNKNTTIEENSAENGGGVAFYNGTFRMESGSITKNSASASYSSGVSIRQRTDKPADMAYFYHSGGSITQNNNGGMLVDIDYSYYVSDPSRNIILSGGATIEDNTGTNLYLADDLTVITIADALSGRYYVDAQTNAGDANTIAIAGDEYTITPSDLGCIISDNDEKVLYLEDNQLKIVNSNYYAPQAAETRVLKSTEIQASVNFTLSYAPTGEYKVYSSSDTSSQHPTVTASLSGNTLTLNDIDGDIDEGTYYIRVLKDGGILTNPLVLRVTSEILPGEFDLSRGSVSVEDGTEDHTIKISYNGKEYDNYNYDTQLVIVGESTNTVSVNTTGSDTVNIILSNVSISTYDGWPAVDLQGGSNVIITLIGDNILQGGSGRAGLQVEEGATLTLKGSGTLTTKGGNQGAGIGGKYISGSGIINIESGTITAQGGEHAPGIGTGGTYGVGTSISAGAIHISGGTVTAYGSGRADGIGHGSSGTVTSITLSGGSVTASAGEEWGQALTIAPVLYNKMGPISGGWSGSRCVYGSKSAAPAANVVTVAKSQLTQSAVSFTLTTAPEGTYAVYTDSEKTAVHSTVTAALAGTTLTLSDSDGDINPGIYYIAVTEDGLAEGDALALTVERESYQSVLDISGSNIKIENGSTAGTIKITSYGLVYDNIDPAANTLQITGTTTQNGIIVNTANGVIVNVKLKNVSIDVSATSNQCAFDIQDNSVVNLSFEGTNTIKSGDYRAGIMARNNDGRTATLVIEGNGTLNVSGGAFAAGIGGYLHYDGGNIHIKGGTIVAESKRNANAIDAVSIKISGGSVTARTDEDNTAFAFEPVFENDMGYVSGYYTHSTVVIGEVSKAPNADLKTVAKESFIQASVDFTLTTATDGEYEVYAGNEDNPALHPTVTAARSGFTLTLTDSDGNIDQGTYYIRVTEVGKPRSNPLALTITPYAPSYETAINLENGSILFEDGASGKIKITQGSRVTDNLDPSLNFTIIGNSTLNTITINTSVDKTLKLTLQDVTIDVSSVPESCALALQNGASAAVTIDGANVLKSGVGRAGIEVAGTDSAASSISIGGTGTLEVAGKMNGIGADIQGGGTVTITGGIITAIGGGSYGALSGEPTLLNGVICVYGSYSDNKAVFAVESEAPAADVSEICKASEQQESVTFTLTTAPVGTYQVYVTDSFYSDEHPTVTASLSGTELTLTDSDGNLDVGTYYIRVTQSGKAKSTVLALTVLDMPLHSFDIVTSSVYIEDGTNEGTIKILYNDIIYDNLDPSEHIRVTGNSGSERRDISVNTSADITVALVLDGVRLADKYGNYSPLSIRGSSKVTLTIVNSNTLSSDAYHAGVEVAPDASVTIRGSGTLNSIGSTYSAGIGGLQWQKCGTITIESGTIIARGGSRAAGIGRGLEGSGGTITIKDGNVTAIGDSDGEGIAGSVVTIEGGTVEAQGGWKDNSKGGIGITGSIVTIKGGTVTVIGGTNAAGIIGDTVTIDAGTVKSTNGGRGEGIGGSTIQINGGTVEATGGEYSPGIGGTINISGGAVTAKGGMRGAGIGGGNQSGAGTIVINGGTITAQGGEKGAGIGGGYQGYGGTITINGGNVTGRAGADASGIGSGYFGSVDSITISGGSVTARAAYTGAGSLTAMSTAPTLLKNVYLVDGKWDHLLLVVYGEKFTPIISDISAPSTVEGLKLTLTVPTVSDNGKEVTAQGWQISSSGANDWEAFDPDAVAMTVADSGKYIRYFATNEDGTTYSNTVQITVTEKQIQSIEVKTPPTKTVYKITQYFDPTGLVITIVYDNGEEVDVQYADNEAQFGFEPSAETALTTSNTQVTITYRDKTVNQPITVLDKELQSIAVKTAPTKTSYIEEEDFDPSGLVITATYDIGDPVDIEYSEATRDAFGFSPSQNLAVSDNTIEITYGGKETTQQITVRNKQLTGIAIHTTSLKTVYIEGNDFDPTGLVITASYDNGSQENIAYAGNETLFNISPLTGLATTDGSVTITYGGKTAEQAITVNEKQLESITVKTPPAKLRYRVGQSFNPAELVITMHYDNGQSIDVPYVGNEASFGFSPADNLQTDTVNVVITCGGKTANQAITVLEKETVSVSEAQQTATYDGSSKTFAVTGTALSGFTVAYRQGENMVTPVNAGTYDVTITRFEDDDNKPFSTTITDGLIISPITAELSWQGAYSRTYDGNDSNVTATVTNLIGSDICAVTVTGGTQKDAGTHTATATALSNGNYILPSNVVQTYSIAKREAVLSWTGTHARTYDGNDSNVTAAVTNLIEGDICSVTVTGGTQKDAGTHTATATALSNDNYILPSNAEQTYSIAKREAVLSWTGSDARTYDGSESNVTATVANLVSGAACTVTVTGGTEKNAGTYTATATVLSNDNYVLPSNVEQTYSIAKREGVLSWTGADARTYDGSESNVTAAVANLVSGDACTVTVTGGTEKDAGTHTATATALSNSNYSLPQDAAQSYTINRKAAAVTAEAKEKLVGASDPALTVTKTGVIDGDIIGTINREAGEAAGKYPIKISATNPNYMVTFVGSYFTIKSKDNETVPEPTGTIAGTLVGATADTSTRLLYQGKTFGEVWGSEFTFNHLADGIYNIEITKGTATKTVDVEVVDGTQTVVPLVIDITTIQKSTKISIVGDDTPNVVIGNMEDAIENGAEFSIVIEKTDADETIVQKAKSKTIAVNLDITAFLNYQPSTSLNKIIKITIPIPKEAKGKKVTIYRKHNDTIDELAEGIANAVDGEYFVVRRNGLEIVELYVNKFSDYTLAYTKSSSGSGGSGRTLSAITASLKSGEVAVGSEVTLTTSVKDGIIYYTTNGEKPTTKSMVYEKPIAIEKEMVIKAMVNGGNVVTFTYTVRPAKIEFTDNADETRYIAAYSEDTFKPDQAITRYEMIESLSNLLSIETVSTGKVFTDIDEEAADLVNLFAGARIIEGYEDGTFKGGQGMTRAEFVKVMSVILNLDIKDGKSTFSDTNGHWSDRYIAEFAKLGYLKGYEDGSFKPDQKMTRAEFVAIVNRIIQKSGVSVPPVFSDLSAEHWAYADIMAAYLK